jgi:hypothetical protein
MHSYLEFDMLNKMEFFCKTFTGIHEQTEEKTDSQCLPHSIGQIE